MTYGDSKIKDIAESVLPSSRRKGARNDLRNVKQKNRRSINRQLARIDSTDTYFDDSRIENIDYYPNKDIRQVVYSRRGADNVSALMHWAEYRVKKEGIADPHDRYNFVKKMMPGSLPGRHAMTHVADVEGFCDGKGGSFRSGCETHARAYRFKSDNGKTVTKDEYVQFFRELLEKQGQHKALNAAIKRAHTAGHLDNIPGTMHVGSNGRYAYMTEKTVCSGCARPRVLLGYDDIEAWVVDVFFPRSNAFKIWRQHYGHSEYSFGVAWVERMRPHPEWGQAARKFMER